MAQLVRAPPCHGGGRGFESHSGRYAGMAELADAQDLKSCGTNLPYRFDSGCRHEKKLRILILRKSSELFCRLYKAKRRTTVIPGTAGYGSPYLLQNFGVEANALDKAGDK